MNNFPKKHILSIILIIFASQILLAQSPAKKITAKEYIASYKDIAMRKMLEYKIPASITLAQGLLESGNGNSALALEANNHFGIKCHLDWQGETFYMDDDEKDECFRKYSNPEESFKDHSIFLSTRDRYAFLFELEITDYKAWAKGLKEAGYATNPKYPKLLIDIIERNNLSELDKEAENYIAENKEIIKKPKENISENKVVEKEEVIITTTQRKILTNNRIKYIIAQKDDDIEKICQELDMFEWQIIKYNELKKGDVIKTGQIVYLQPKRKNGEKKFHTVEQGETMYSISQKYGIKLKYLYKKNLMELGTQAKCGQKLSLKKPMKPTK